MSITKLTNSGLSGDKYPNLMADNTFMEPIATQLLSGTQSSIEFTNIPQIYKHLQIRMLGIFTGTVSAGYIAFNGDNASGSYSAHDIYGDSANAYSHNSVSQNKGYFTLDAGTSPTQPNVMIMDILDYTNQNKYKTTRHFYAWDNNGSGYVEFTSNNWRSTSPITSIKLTTSGNSWTTNSRISLYGIRG